MEKIFFIGINGIGMSGLAKIMKMKGYEVAGSDLTRNYVTEELESLGIKVFPNHVAENVIGFDRIIASSAIKKNNPEYIYAIENKIKMIKRGELLAELFNRETGIAIAGTHGKTTTSSMMARALEDKDPTVVVGGIIPEMGSNAKPGKSEYFIAEADESDNSFLYLNPEYSIILNIEADHLENHGSLENIEKSFKQFMDQTKSQIIACGECENVLKLIAGRENAVTYAIADKNADIYADNIKIIHGKTEYDVFLHGKNIGKFALSIPGRHNILNSLPVIYLANKLGVKDESVRENLFNFKGAKRRYDILHEGTVKIIDDYAHHPTEIKATIQGAKSIESKKISAIFQPHRYSRVNFLLEEFKNVFDGVDEVFLLPVYSAGEENIYNVTLEDLKKKINHRNTVILDEFSKIEEIVENCHEERVYIFMGAGDISKIAHKIAEKLKG